MGKVVFSLVSKDSEKNYLQASATSPSFSATTSFNCQNKDLVEFGKKIKGFPKAADQRLDYSIGSGKGKAIFMFKTIKETGLCELWIKIKGLEDDQGNGAEAFFPIDYLEPSAIEAFSIELIKIGTGHSNLAELKNKFEKNKSPA